MDRTSDFGSDSEGSNPSAVTFREKAFLKMLFPFFGNGSDMEFLINFIDNQYHHTERR